MLKYAVLPTASTNRMHLFAEASDGNSSVIEGGGENEIHWQIKYNMRKSLDIEDEGCYLQPGNRGSLLECGFNATAKTILVIHGWTVSIKLDYIFLNFI